MKIPIDSGSKSVKNPINLRIRHLIYDKILVIKDHKRPYHQE